MARTLTTRFSTFALAAALGTASFAARGLKCMYISGEEAAAQVRMRAQPATDPLPGRHPAPASAQAPLWRLGFRPFYLLAAERGLGAFYTAAINDADVAALLKLRPQVEIAIGANGVGVPDPSRDVLHLKPVPWAPVAE